MTNDIFNDKIREDLVRQAIRDEGATAEAFKLIEEIYEIYYLKKIEIEFESCNDSYRLMKQLRTELKGE